MVLVVVLILLTLILGVAAIILWADFKEKERTALALKQLPAKLDQEDSELRQLMKAVNEPTGFQMTGEGGADLPREKPAELVKAKRLEYVSGEALNKFPLVENLDKGRKDLNADQVRTFNAARDESEFMGTLEALVRPAAARTFHYWNRMKQLEIDLEVAKTQAANREAIKPEYLPRPTAMRDKLIADIKTINDEITKENEQYNARKAKFTEDRGKAETEIQAEVEKFAADEIKINNEIRELKRQLEELKVKEVIAHEISFVHGKILQPDIPNKVGFIDIGARERVVPGLKFLVGRKGAQGKFDYKGKVEVKKAWMTYCEVSIIEVYDPKERPIVEGDLLVNPLFSKDGPVAVAFVGEERPIRLRYSVDEATRRIKEIGSEVRKVGLDVDYVIFTEGTTSKPRESYEEFKKAVFLEIPIAEASEIFRFLGD
jgi:hypothetical protein